MSKVLITTQEAQWLDFQEQGDEFKRYQCWSFSYPLRSHLFITGQEIQARETDEIKACHNEKLLLPHPDVRSLNELYQR